MNRTTIIASVMFLSGCGSCVEDKKEPVTTPAPSTLVTVKKITEAGVRPVVVSDPLNHADVFKDAGAR